jgi:2-keto-4-pentenoate hydratase
MFRRKRLAELPIEVRPRTSEEAYVCQRGVVEQWLQHFGGTAIGYKIACTNEVAQRQLRVDTPFTGRLLSSLCYESGVCRKADNYFMRVIEAEFGFRMARDLPPRGSTLGMEDVAAAVEGVMPVIELVDSRFDSWTTVGTPSLIADNACHAGWVMGSLVTDWKGFDLAAQAVKLEINGALKTTGSGAAVLGHPLKALAWLANALHKTGAGLKAGDYVSTGVTTDVYMAQAGDHIRADFGSLGSVEVVFE